jgi:hypothetical protein
VAPPAFNGSAGGDTDEDERDKGRAVSDARARIKQAIMKVQQCPSVDLFENYP